jgi:EamA domain-containing membrane protein RarD
MQIGREQWMAIGLAAVGVAAAFFLLDQHEPWQVRVLPWVLVFGYPAWRFVRGATRGQSRR